MRKQKLGLLAAASCVLLGGCSQISQIIPQGLLEKLDVLHIFNGGSSKVKSELPEQALVGDVFILDELVTVDGVEDLSFELDDESYSFASLDETILSIFAPGTIKVRVLNGSKVLKTLEISTVSKLDYEFNKALNEVTDRYSFVSVQNSNLVYTDYGPNYTYGSNYSLDAYNQQTVGGFMQGKDGTIYTYTYTPGATLSAPGSIAYTLVGDEPRSMSDVRTSFSVLKDLPFEKYNANGLEAYILMRDDAGVHADIANKLFGVGINLDYLTVGGFDYMMVTYVSETLRSKQGNVTVEGLKFQVVFGGGYLWSEGILTDYHENTFVKEIAEGEGPQSSVDCTEKYGKPLLDVVENGKNFQIDVVSQFYKTNGSTKVPSANPYGSEEYSNLVLHQMANAEAHVYATENEILKVVKDQPELTEGLVINENEIFNVLYHDDQIVGEYLKAGTNLYDDSISMVDNCKFITSKPINDEGETLWDKLFVISSSTQSGSTTDKIAPISGCDLLKYFGVVLFGKTADTEAINLASTVDVIVGKYKFYEIFDASVSAKYSGSTLKSVTIDYVMDMSLFGDELLAPYTYSFKITISNFGTTVIPSGYDITLLED